jgi:hypothetical protein
MSHLARRMYVCYDPRESKPLSPTATLFGSNTSLLATSDHPLNIVVLAGANGVEDPVLSDHNHVLSSEMPLGWKTAEVTPPEKGAKNINQPTFATKNPSIEDWLVAPSLYAVSSRVKLTWSPGCKIFVDPLPCSIQVETKLHVFLGERPVNGPIIVRSSKPSLARTRWISSGD